MNPYYLENIEQIKQVFEQEGVVSLFDFLSKSEFKDLEKKVKVLKLKHEKAVLTHSYSKVSLTSSFFSDQIITLFEKITNTNMSNITLYQFKHKDYTILHDAVLQKEGVDIVFNITDWQDGWGGSVFYVNNTGEYTQLPNNSNCLTIKRREKGEQWFAKYVNCLAKTKKLFIVLSSQCLE